MIPTEEQIVDILRTLIAFPTVSADTNLPLMEWVEAYLDSHGVPHWRVAESASKTSLLARIGPELPGGIVLSGHTDVVPVRAQPWDTDPFELIDGGDRFYGRGTCDMKSFVALALAYVPYFQKTCLARSIWLAFSHDEEIGCLAAADVAKGLIAAKADPSLVVVGEPTNMKLIGVHKGIQSFETIVTGREAHSSMPEQGVNAVMVMGEVIATLNQIAAAARAQRNADFASVTPYASVHIGVVEGGTARNIVPRHCRIAWEVRPLPETDMDALLAPFHARMAELEVQMKTVDAGCSIVTRPLTSVVGLQRLEAQSEGYNMACHLSESNHAECVAFGTEAGIFQSHGLPTIVCGPGSIDQAHQPNEFITREQLALGAAFMQRVGDACTSR